MHFEVRLAVEGMTCGACERTVRAALAPAAAPLPLPHGARVTAVTDADAAAGRAAAIVSVAGPPSSASAAELPPEVGAALAAALEAVGFDAHVTSVKALTEEEAAAAARAAAKSAALPTPPSPPPPHAPPSAAGSPGDGGNGADAAPVLATATFEIGGMTCGSCVRSVEAAAHNATGVVAVAVSLPMASAEVTFDAAATGVAEIAAAVRAAGYTAKHVPTVEGDDAAMQEQIARREAAARRALRAAAARLVFALAFTIPLMVLTLLMGHNLFSASTTGSGGGGNGGDGGMDGEDGMSAEGGLYREVAPGLDVITVVSWALATPVQFVSGWPFYVGAIADMRRRTLTMNFLVASGTSAAYLYSVLMVFLAIADGTPNPDVLFFDTSAMLISFILLGKLLQLVAQRGASNAITKLMALRPEVAVLMAEWPSQSVEREVPVKELVAGDVVKIVRGARVPADGVIANGAVALNESMLTGESMPVTRGVGGAVIGGTVCEEGYAYCRVTRTGAASALSQIIAMVQRAQASKPPIQDLGDRASAVFVPVVLALSVLTFVVWIALAYSGAIPESWYRDLPGHPNGALFAFMFALSVLVIACPCAVGLASPMAVVVGMGVGASNGVLIKGSAALQKATKLTAIAFDKTGTLTQGRPQVTDHLAVLAPRARRAALDSTTVLRLVASAERASEHPLARAIVAHAAAAGAAPAPIVDGSFEAVSGKGVSCRVAAAALAPPPPVQAADGANGDTPPATAAEGEGEEFTVAVGSPSYIRAFIAATAASGSGKDISTTSDMSAPATAIAPAAGGCCGGKSTTASGGKGGGGGGSDGFLRTVEELVAGLEGGGKTAVCAAVGGAVVAVFGISDAIRPEAPDVVRQLQRQGVDVWMVTGDNALTARSVAAQLGIKPEYVMSEVLPGSKADKVGELQARGGVVAFVGDGINDAPALARADVGIAIGSGTDVALESADMVLMRGKLQDVLTAISISHAIFNRIKANFAWAFGYNCLGIPIAMGVLFPLTHRTLPPALAGLAMALSSVSVVLSSLMLRLYRRPRSVRRIDDAATATASAAAGGERGSVEDGLVVLEPDLPPPVHVTVATVDPDCSCLCCKSCNTVGEMSTIASATTKARARRRSVGALLLRTLRKPASSAAAARHSGAAVGDAGAAGASRRAANDTDSEGDDDDVCPSCPSCAGRGAAAAPPAPPTTASRAGSGACQCRCSWCKCASNGQEG